MYPALGDSRGLIAASMRQVRARTEREKNDGWRGNKRGTKWRRLDIEWSFEMMRGRQESGSGSGSGRGSHTHRDGIPERVSLSRSSSGTRTDGRGEGRALGNERGR